jgi:hypothetical protein
MQRTTRRRSKMMLNVECTGGGKPESRDGWRDWKRASAGDTSFPAAVADHRQLLRRLLGLSGVDPWRPFPGAEREFLSRDGRHLANFRKSRALSDD